MPRRSYARVVTLPASLPSPKDIAPDARACTHCGTAVTDGLSDMDFLVRFPDESLPVAATFDAAAAGLCPACLQPLADGAELDAFIARAAADDSEF